MLWIAVSQLSCQILLLVGFVLSASAAMIHYDNRAAWEAAVGSFVTEDFESVPLQRAAPLGGVIATSGFDIVYPSDHDYIGIFGSSNHFFRGDVHCSRLPCDGPPPRPGRNPGDPNRYPGDPQFNDIVFHHEISAFGVDVLSVEDSDGDPTTRETIRLRIAGQDFEVGRLEFFGVVSDVPFTVIHIEGPVLTYDLDNVSSVPAPEPSTALLVAAGLAGMAALRRSPSDMLRRR